MLIRAALADERRFDRFVLLSGADYPLRSAAEIERFFAADPDKEFMNLVPMPYEGKPISRLINYKLRPGTPRPLRAVQRGLMVLRLLPRERDYKRCFGELLPYAGSTWWALSREACEYVSSFAAREKGWVRFHEHTRCPDESFFQTIVGNSPLRPRIARNLTWADWSREGGAKGAGSPATLGLSHMPYLVSDPSFDEKVIYGAGPILFARKFRNDSAELVVSIDRHIAERAAQRA
jgi:hypothetical protein